LSLFPTEWDSLARDGDVRGQVDGRLPLGGLGSLAIMTAFGALLLIGGRSETIRGLRGDESDERFRQMDVHASAIAGLTVITPIIVAFVVELAGGDSGSACG